MQDRFFAIFTLGWVITDGSVLASYPIDTFCRRIMMTSGEAIKYKSSLDSFSQILKNEGAKSLFKGAGANILRVVVGVLTGYDKLQMIVFEKKNCAELDATYEKPVFLPLVSSVLERHDEIQRCTGKAHHRLLQACSLGPSKGLEEKRILADTKDFSFNYTPKTLQTVLEEIAAEPAPVNQKLPLPSMSSTSKATQDFWWRKPRSLL
ncbi:hypothetical protein HHK36_007037 [Tetracentron sinense]|uniref:ADP/ATP translocase n=1 Tax=Tetracentron sinense TaxID=13715 RepID=A0A835DPL5_TETSI|nr:hypothetical protein HHK36_007037 [Tetracentron sinense]